MKYSKWKIYTVSAAFFVAGAMTAVVAAQTAERSLTQRDVAPTVADPTLKTDFDAPNLILIPGGELRRELVVFLPGTHGKPKDFMTLQRSIASGGYRVVSLMYNDGDMERAVCGAENDPRCPGAFRRERIFGDAPDAPVQNTKQEAIVSRLVSLLKYEAQANPTEGWDAYLKGDAPNWPSIVIAGHSQGAGNAAYIAKYEPVARVVLFSGGPDAVGRELGTPKLSSWVLEPGSKTPPDRWWAEYHPKEPAGPLLPLGYAALHIPKDHVFELTLEPPSTVKAQGKVAYHMAVVADQRYLPQWQKMFGIDAQ
jgi:pimeloyl-ACP methyl ester carboxylesterase